MGLLVLVVGSGIVLWQIRQGAPNSSHSREASGPTQSISVVAARQRGSFSLLRSRPEGLPRAVAQILPLSLYEMNFSLAQRIVGAPGRYWAVPGNGLLCIASDVRGESVGLTCAKTADAITRGVATTVIESTRHSKGGTERTIVGIAPDGVRQVRLFTGGLADTVLVGNENAFLLRDSKSRPPDRIVALRGEK